ncbi:MAG TPA: ATP-binding cassette domain-containing protein [Marinilabiliaceae bacterium]|nr:ATP-binding cassette domain-containing protein [Marinilabiliaceae bacterium]
MTNIKELYSDSVQFSYESSQQLLTGAYLRCPVGEVVGLLGRNGCGKSTFLKILFGVLKAKNSYILINNKKTEKAYLTNKIGYLPQDSFLPTHEKVDYLIRLLIKDQQVRNILSYDARIKTISDKKIYQLSGGELRYLEICLLMHQPTDFVLLDEPFTGLEPLYMEQIATLILRFKTKKGIVLSDHNYQNVLDIATQILLLHNGTCRLIKNKKELEFFYAPEGIFDQQGPFSD